MKLALAICLLLPTTALAGHRVKVRERVFVVTQFATPVLLPVAPFSAVAYSGVQSAAVGATSAESEDERITRIVLRVLAEMNKVQATAQQTRLQQHCGKCHGAEAKNVERFSIVEPLTDRQRLKAAKMLLLDNPEKRMPQGGTLSPEELGLLLQELTDAPDEE